MRLYILTFLSVVVLGFSVFSFKASKFSGDPKLFTEELRDFMKNISEIHESALEDFIQAWDEDSVFTPKEQEDVIRLSQMLEAKNGRPYPHFINFLKCMLVIKSSNIPTDNYDSWVKGMEYHLELQKANTSMLNSLLEFSYNLFNENYIYQSASTRWKATSNKYSIVAEDGLFVEFEKTDLICYTRSDSITVFDTKGIVNPVENQWIGKGGLVTWEAGGYSREQVFAKIEDYKIDLSRSEYEAKNVKFTNTLYFDEPLEGDLEDKVRHYSSQENATYPRFYSYTKTFYINDLYKDIDYSGGLSMQGAKLVGTGTQENNAKLLIYRNDTLVVVANSLYFGFKADQVNSESSSITIKLKNDSIYHPDLLFNYRVDNRELNLLKSQNFSSQGPFSNSYHQVDMNFDRLTWSLSQDYMRFTAPRGSSIGNAYFESVNYFNYNKYVDMQMMDRIHPLIALRSFAARYGSNEFPIEAYASYLKMSVNQVQQQAMRMANLGFVYYDSNNQTIRLKPRLDDNVAASVNRIDYDVISFQSRVESPLENALFNLKNYDLTINGIPQIYVSDSQNVAIIPKFSRIILKHNRSFQFDGTVVAGLLTFYGKNMFFNYDSFKINLQNIDSIQIDYQTGAYDNYGMPLIGNVTNLIRSVTGEVLIDRADNKSGRVSYPQYPIFMSKEKSYVYYNSQGVQGGVYGANDFYFEVDTFRMDSLDNFNAYAMVFDGKFVSAGILPEFDQQLSLQEDNSLGFKHNTPPEGMALYGGKGKFTSELWLSNRGLRGNGTMDYLTSTTWSDDFVFYPDSMNTLAEKFQIRRQTTMDQYPGVNSLENDIHWEPYNDVMWAHKTNTDFTMFNDSTKLSGHLQLEPAGLSGWGRMDLKSADLVSDLFTYKADAINSDTADFYLKSIVKEGFTVLTDNVKTNISFTNRAGVFKSNEGYSLVTFPENKYISYIDEFMWDMDNKTLAMGSNTTSEIPDYTKEDTEPVGPRFISTDKQQDSLSFISPLAYYDYQNNFINATGVKFIEVADARIYPKEGLLTVQPDFKIKTLEDAWLKADTGTQFHRIHGATLNIHSIHEYDGMGNYDYVDENGDIQLIHFSSIRVDSTQHTLAMGEIFESADFTLSPVFKYQGDVTLRAMDSLLTFKGATLLEHNCDNLKPDWVLFETQIDPNDIYIPVNAEALNYNRQKIYTGSFVYYDSVHVYPAFFNGRKNYSDSRMITAQGYLHYDKASQLYKIGSKEKINNFSLAENYISLHREDCILYNEGEVDLGQDLGMVALKNYGSVTNYLEENKTELDLVMALDFFMSDNMLNIMGNEIDSFPNLEPVNLTSDINLKTLNAWIGNDKAQAIRDELNLFGTINELPKELNHTILLNDLKLIWNDQTNSYQSEGKIGIASINGIQINKKIDGFLELGIKRSGDVFDLYLQLDRRNYYYFGYTRGVMQTLSHNKAYVETIMNMKTKQRKLKTTRSQTPYNYLISTDRKKNNFYRRWQDMLNNVEPTEDE